MPGSGAFFLSLMERDTDDTSLDSGFSVIMFHTFQLGDETYAVIIFRGKGMPTHVIPVIDNSGSMGFYGGHRIKIANRLHGLGPKTLYYNSVAEVVSAALPPLHAGGRTNFEEAIKMLHPMYTNWRANHPNVPCHVMIASDGGSIIPDTLKVLNDLFAEHAHPLNTTTVLLLGNEGNADFGWKLNAALNGGKSQTFTKLFHNDPPHKTEEDRNATFMKIKEDIPVWTEVEFDDGSREFVPVISQENGTSTVLFPLSGKKPASIQGQHLPEPKEVAPSEYASLLGTFLTDGVKSQALSAGHDKRRQEEAQMRASKNLKLFQLLAENMQNEEQVPDKNAEWYARKAMMTKSFELDQHATVLQAIIDGTFGRAKSVKELMGFLDMGKVSRKQAKKGVGQNELAEHVSGLAARLRHMSIENPDNTNLEFALQVFGTDRSFPNALEMVAKNPDLDISKLTQLLHTMLRDMPGWIVYGEPDAAAQGDALCGMRVVKIGGFTCLQGMATLQIAGGEAGDQPNMGIKTILLSLLAPGGNFDVFKAIINNSLMNISMHSANIGLPGCNVPNAYLGILISVVAHVITAQSMVPAEMSEALFYTCNQWFKQHPAFSQLLKVLADPEACRLVFVNESTRLGSLLVDRGHKRRDKGCPSMIFAICLLWHAQQQLKLTDDHWFEIGKAMIEELLALILRGKTLDDAFEVVGELELKELQAEDFNFVVRVSRHSKEITKNLQNEWRKLAPADFMNDANEVVVKVKKALSDGIFSKKTRGGITIQHVLNLFPQELARRLINWVNVYFPDLVWAVIMTDKAMNRMMQEYVVVCPDSGKPVPPDQSFRGLPSVPYDFLFDRFIEKELYKHMAENFTKIRDELLQVFLDKVEHAHKRYEDHQMWSTEEEALAAAKAAFEERKFPPETIKRMLNALVYDPRTCTWKNACNCWTCGQFAHTEKFSAHMGDVEEVSQPGDEYARGYYRILPDYAKKHTVCKESEFKAKLKKHLTKQRQETGDNKFNPNAVDKIPDNDILDRFLIFRKRHKVAELAEAQEQLRLKPNDPGLQAAVDSLKNDLALMESAPAPTPAPVAPAPEKEKGSELGAS